jgi:hypothetical protein
MSTRANHIDDLVNLDDAGDVSVVALVGDEVGGSGFEGEQQLVDGVEEDVADGVVERRRARRKAAEPFVDLQTDQSSRCEKPAGELEMMAEVVIPVEPGPGRSGVHDAQSDHAREDSTGLGWDRFYSPTFREKREE